MQTHSSGEDAAHIRAIAVPIYATQAGKERQWMAEVAGSIAGLRHIGYGMPMPMVAYHVDGPKMGGFTAWGAP